MILLRKTLTMLVAVLTVCVSGVVRAEFTASEYLELKDLPEMKSYVTGVGRGILWTNSVAVNQYGHPPLFCVPTKFGMDETVILSLLDQEIRRPSRDYQPETFPIELILVVSFQERFPCD